MGTFIQKTVKQYFTPEIPPITLLSCYFILMFLVVGGLFLYFTDPNRDINTTIKRRFFGLAMVILVPAFLIISWRYIPKFLGLWEEVPITYALTSTVLLPLPMLVNLRNALVI